MRHAAILVSVSALALGSCVWFEDNPYADFSVGKVDEDEVERAATILVGDPQVISRETLVNDRLREIQHIDKMLAESKDKAKFEPQIARDLSVIEAFTSQLGISYNPALGVQFERREQLETLKADIEELKLRQEVRELERLSQQDPENPRLDPANVTPGAPQDLTVPSTNPVTDRLNTLLANVEKFRKQLADQSGAPRARRSKFDQTADEHFEDLNAYRARLRQRQSEVQLDDVHDANGNTLYRLQFMATVLPGEIKNKFGVLNFDIAPPEVTNKEIADLYQVWLLSLMERNASFAEEEARLQDKNSEDKQVKDDLEELDRARSEWGRMQTVFIRREFVDRILLSLYPDQGGEKIDDILFVHPDDYFAIDEILGTISAIEREYGKYGKGKVAVDGSTWRELAASPPEFLKLLHGTGLLYNDQLFDPDDRAALAHYRDAAALGRFDDPFSELVDARIDPETCELASSPSPQFRRLLETAWNIRETFKSQRVIEVFIENAIIRSKRSSDSKRLKYLNWLKGTLEAASAAAEIFVQSVPPSILGSSAPDDCRTIKKKANLAPEEFFVELTDVESLEKEEIAIYNDPKRILNAKWSGEPYTYQAQPTERVQRLSTLSSAVNSMQAAFALAATLPAEGIGIDAGAAAARNAVGLVEAVERTPIVVGYTDRRNSASDGPADGAGFGFVFGPKAVLDPEEKQLVYRQVAKSHAVYADISVPALWPELILRPQTAWVGNWHAGADVLEFSHRDREIRVRLRPDRFDINLLTEVLAKRSIIGEAERTVIKEVSPASISACAKEVEFVVLGNNLWRGTDAYLRGQRHSSLRVLPDMKGIAVGFNVEKLPSRPKPDSSSELIVVTSFGQDTYPIEIVNTLDGKPCPAGTKKAEAAISLESTTLRIIGGQDNTVVIKPVKPLPKSAGNEAVIAQIQPRGTTVPDKIIVADSTPDPFGGPFSGKFEAKSLSFKGSSYDGVPVKVGLQYQTRALGAVSQAFAKQAIIYYPDAVSSNFNIVTKETNGFGASNTIEIRTPTSLATAYPGFEAVKNAFTAKVKEHPKVSPGVTAAWDLAKNKVVLTLVKPGNTTAEEKNFYSKGCGKKALTIEFAVANKKQNHPGFTANIVKLKKTASC